MEKQTFLVPIKFEMKGKLKCETYKKAERQMAYIVFKNAQKIEDFIQKLCKEELEQLEKEMTKEE